MSQLRDKWIAEVLESAKDTAAVTASPFTHTRVFAKIDAAARMASTNSIAPRWVLAAAAGFGLLVILNVMMIRRPLTKAVNNEDGVSQVMQEYSISAGTIY